MVDISTKITEFFREQWLHDEKVRQQGIIPSLGAEMRAEAFRTEGEKQIILKESRFASELSATLYEIRYKSLTAILAFYGDEELLWLDNHSNNRDFETFIRRENLKQWIANKKTDFINLSLDTKFNFLNGPQLLSDIGDIPRLSHKKQASIIEYGGENHIKEMDAKLATLSKEITNLQSKTDTQSMTILDFFIWTSFLGRVIEIQCFYSFDGIFTYEGNQMATGIGDYVPLA